MTLAIICSSHRFPRYPLPKYHSYSTCTQSNRITFPLLLLVYSTTKVDSHPLSRVDRLTLTDSTKPQYWHPAMKTRIVPSRMLLSWARVPGNPNIPKSKVNPRADIVHSPSTNRSHPCSHLGAGFYLCTEPHARDSAGRPRTPLRTYPQRIRAHTCTYSNGLASQ